jgi:hypothetical protein
MTPCGADCVDDRSTLGGRPKPAAVEYLSQFIWTRYPTPFGHG